MIEVVARAAWDSILDQCAAHKDKSKVKRVVMVSEAHVRKATRAALSALREPSPAMVEAMISKLYPNMMKMQNEEIRQSLRDEQKEAWQAAIDAALGEREARG